MLSEFRPCHISVSGFGKHQRLVSLFRERVTRLTFLSLFDFWSTKSYFYFQSKRTGTNQTSDEFQFKKVLSYISNMFDNNHSLFLWLPFYWTAKKLYKKDGSKTTHSVTLWVLVAINTSRVNACKKLSHHHDNIFVPPELGY